MSNQDIKVDYYDLLVFVRTYIDRNYGSITKFFHSEDAKKCGLKDTTQEKNKLMNYLSIPKEQAEKKVMSVPMLKSLLKGLLGIEVKAETRVTRITEIYLPMSVYMMNREYLNKSHRNTLP